MYVKLEDATALRFGDQQTPVETLADYLGWQAEIVTSRGIARVWKSDRPTVARINHGRLLADCQSCGSGMFTHAEWRVALCAECGASYNGVVIPEKLDKITELLLKRPDRRTQNWEPGESVRWLTLENLTHGIR